jgi:hypothetical protein
MNPMLTSISRTIKASAMSLVALGLSLSAPSSASAGGQILPTQTCATTQGVVMQAVGEQFTVLVSVGDTVQMTSMPASGLGTNWYRPDGNELINFTSPASLTYVAETGVGGVTVESTQSQVTVSCSVAMVPDPLETDTPSDESPEPVQPDLTDTASNLGANSQTNATGSGVSNNTRGRLNGNGASRNLINGNGFFLSTQNMPSGSSDFRNPDWSAWVSGEGRGYSGTLNGRSADIVVGVDK